MNVSPPSHSAIENLLDDILSRPEFQDSGPSLLERVLQAIADFFSELFTRLGRYTTQLGVWAYVLLALVFAALIFVVVRLILRRRPEARRRTASAAARRERPPTAAELLAKADALAAQGLLREASANLMAALLTRLKEYGFITSEPGRTYRQYLNDLRQAEYPGADGFAAFTRIYAGWRYGGRNVAPEQYASWRRALDPLFSGRAAA